MLKKLKEKKGTSLIELIISVALISIVLIFMFRLLLDVNNEQVNDTFAKDNQVIRAEIIRSVESELNNKAIYEIAKVGSTNGTLNINFSYIDGKVATLKLTAETVEFTNSDNQTRKWTLNNCTLYTNRADVYVTQDSNYYSVVIDIEIHTNNDRNTVGNNNPLDDIMLSYLGKTKDYKGGRPENLKCLGNDC